MMKTRALLCAGLLTIGATISLDFTGAMAEGSPQSTRLLALMQKGSTKNAKAKAYAYMVSGNAKFARKDYQGAIADYNRALSLDPNYADAYANRGVARFNLQDYEGAIADYDRSIALDPNHPDVPRTRSDRDWAIQRIQQGRALDQMNRVRNSGGGSR